MLRCNNTDRSGDESISDNRGCGSNGGGGGRGEDGDNCGWDG